MDRLDALLEEGGLRAAHMETGAPLSLHPGPGCRAPTPTSAPAPFVEALQRRGPG